MARRNATRADEKYGVLRDISSNWSPTKAARLLVEFIDRATCDFQENEDDLFRGFAMVNAMNAGWSEDKITELILKLREVPADILRNRYAGEYPVTEYGEGELLRRRTPYVVSPEMTSVLLAAAETLREGDLENEADLLSSALKEGGVLLLPTRVGGRWTTYEGGTFTTHFQVLEWGLDVSGVARITYWERVPNGNVKVPNGIGEASTGLTPLTFGEADDDPGYGLRFLFAFLRLAEQRTTAETVERVPADPGTPKRAPRPEQDVRVTYLRRSASPAPEGEKRAVDWDHRWVVSMHKARQWYPKEKKHKIIFRGPYVKGPADKPIRTTPTVRALVR